MYKYITCTMVKGREHKAVVTGVGGGGGSREAAAPVGLRADVTV